MRCELTDHEWTAIKSMLPNKPRGVPRANDHLVLDGIFRVLRANIQPKSNRNDPICVSPYLYRDRNRIERLFDGIKQCRRVATRYDKLAATYLVFVQLASIRLWLRVYESTPWSHICGNPFSLLCERHVDSDRDKGRIAWPVPKI